MMMTEDQKKKLEGLNKKQTVEIEASKLDELLKRLEKLESASVTTSQIDKITVVGNGQTIGVNTPYSLQVSHYEDPREKLYDLKELQRYAFKQNYELDFVVETTTYETKYGTNFSVPKFKLKLKKLILDDRTGEPIKIEKNGKTFNQGYLMKVGIFFIDPTDAISTAVSLGIDEKDANSTAFLDAMRFELYKRWLLECMNPPKPEPNQAKNQVVIGGSVYEVEEWSTEV